jgi:hypothetical protein
MTETALVQSCLFEANSFKPVLKNQWLASPDFPDLCTLHQSRVAYLCVKEPVVALITRLQACCNGRRRARLADKIAAIRKKRDRYGRSIWLK